MKQPRMQSTGNKALFLALAAAGLLAALVCVAGSTRGRITFAREYARLADRWSRRWPLARGKGAVLRAAPLLSAIGMIPVRAEIEPGVSLLLDPRELVERVILRDGEWEPETWRAISAGLREGADFLDVGAHIGYFTLRSAARVGQSGLVVAFEPNPATVRLLRDNVAASHASNVIIQPVACTDHEQVVTLYDGPASNTGTASLSRENADFFARKGDHHASPHTVRGRPIDDVVRELGLQRVDVVKVDVEGAEYYVLRGAFETLRRFHPKLVVELIPRQLAGMQTKVEDVVSLLGEAGYNHSRRITRSNFEWTVQ